MRSQRKTRTREHIIASQSVAHVERLVFACGFTAERVQHDYGYDLNIYTYDERGGIENGNIYVQIKATDHLTVLADGNTIVQTVEAVDLNFWHGEIMPVILIVYDAQGEEAYWLYVQQALKAFLFSTDTPERRTISVRISKTNVVTVEVLRQFREFKLAILAQKGAVNHNG